ncbi:MAG TPA: hypothetical protein VFS21_22795 [Roseiflexaceae bacterium]|nr:hypothetical protein [Roseiflexaceae bacterium]
MESHLDTHTRALVAALRSGDRAAQNDAFSALLAATETPVGWAYEVWDDLLADLRHRDSHRRAIAAQLLCNLAKSDPAQRALRDLPSLLAVTKDERFVTARHCLQSLWKIGVAGAPGRRAVIDGLAARFQECGTEKNATLIRYDIIQALRNIYNVEPDEGLRETALALIETEADPKYRKKYAGVWRHP